MPTDKPSYYIQKYSTPQIYVKESSKNKYALKDSKVYLNDFHMVLS